MGIRQRVEILKALYREADILILDEPTSVLTPEEIHGLFQTITRLTARGKSVVFITHKLKEVMSLAHGITVLRAGRVVGRTTPADTSEHELAKLMVGRVTPKVKVRPGRTPGEVVLEANGLSVMNDRGLAAVSGVSLRIRSGEVVGLAGVQGNGQTELVHALTGLRGCASGKIVLRGMDLTNRPPRIFSRHGVAHVPEDRHRHGLVNGYSIAENLVLNAYYRPPFSRGLRLFQSRNRAQRRTPDGGLRHPGPERVHSRGQPFRGKPATPCGGPGVFPSVPAPDRGPAPRAAWTWGRRPTSRR